MKKEQLLKKIDAAWDMFIASYADLSDEQLLEPGVVGDWSIKDIIAHVTVWEDEAFKHLPFILKDEKPPLYSVKDGGIDANAMMTERKRKLSLAEVLKEQDQTHRRIVAYIETLPEEQFTTDTKARRRIRLDCYGHYPIHAKAIREWRKRKGYL